MRGNMPLWAAAGMIILVILIVVLMRDRSDKTNCVITYQLKGKEVKRERRTQQQLDELANVGDLLLSEAQTQGLTPQSPVFRQNSSGAARSYMVKVLQGSKIVEMTMIITTG